MNTCLTRAAAVAAAAAAAAASILAPAAGTASAARASDTGGRTPQCATSGFCVTPVLYSSQRQLALAMTATARTPNTPIVVTRINPTDPNQDWTLELFGAQPPGSRTRGGGGQAAAGPHIPAPQLAYLEFTPAGIRSDLCAANVNDLLVLRRCNGSKWQTFIETFLPPGGGIPPGGWWYFLSDVRAAATGRHLAMSSAQIPGARIAFSEPKYISGQWWSESDFCIIDPRRPAAALRTGC